LGESENSVAKFMFLGLTTQVKLNLAEFRVNTLSLMRNVCYVSPLLQAQSKFTSFVLLKIKHIGETKKPKIERCNRKSEAKSINRFPDNITVFFPYNHF
jgi:hypothetical protein